VAVSRQTSSWIAVCSALALAACSSSEPPPSHITPNTQGWWRDKVFYEIFVRSFADSDGNGTGDLRGLTAHLDALNDGDAGTTSDLGVDAVWLMPINPSPSYHGYDVTDYRDVNPAYGSLADFDAFVAAAHSRGIKVILDMVLNHSSSKHPWFLDSWTGAAAPKRDWYVWRDTDPGWRQPFGSFGPTWYPVYGSYYYGVFTSSMPDLNLTNPAVETELVDSMKFWLARGVDGFRLDAVRYYVETAADAGQQDQPGTHDFLRRIRDRLQADYPDALLVAEAWATLDIAATYYGNGDEAQLAFSFELADQMKKAIAAGDATDIVSTLYRIDDALGGKDRGFDAPFLSNHDQRRVMRDLGGDPGAARVAAATLLALPGTPFIYYGEELGMQGGPSQDDVDKRTPYRWNATPGHGFSSGSPWYDAPEAAGVDLATQQADPGSLWHLYRNLVALRHAQTPLSKGSSSIPALRAAPAGVMALLRTDGQKRVLFVANVGTAAAGSFGVGVATPGTPTVLLQEGLGTASPTSSEVTVSALAPRGFAFLSL